MLKFAKKYLPEKIHSLILFMRSFRKFKKEISKDKCLVTLNYKFKLSGIQVLLYPILKILLPIWNERAWKEDLPLKERRQKVKRMNFKDFEGLPKNIEDRKFDGEINFNIPVRRLRKSDNQLIKHIFYKFKKN